MQKKILGYKPEFSYIRYLEDYKKEQKLNRFAELLEEIKR